MVDKQSLRERIWRELEHRGVVTFPRPARGRIPNFVGSDLAAARLLSLPVYSSAKVIMINPDAAQLPVREFALRDGKQLLMATPRLRRGFIQLDPKSIHNPRKAASIKGAFYYGQQVDLKNLKVDLIVEGSVAVDLRGGRIGKGSGWGDLEYAILREYEAADENTPIATTVHDLQMVPPILMTPHDVPVDIIATPTQLILTKSNHPRPSGIKWEELENSKIREVPILQELKKGKGA